MAGIRTMHEAFLHELFDVYDAEHQLTKALPELAEMAQHSQVKQGLQQHLKETEQQIKNLDRVFASLGAKSKQVSCKGMAGILSEGKGMLKEIMAPELKDGAIVGGGCKVEHYEIASYQGLVSKARLMGHTEAAQLLQQNLQMEEQFAKKLEQIDQQLGQELVRQPNLIGHEIGQSPSGMNAQ